MLNDSTVFPHVGLLLNSGGRTRLLQIENIQSEYTYQNAEYIPYNTIGCFDLLLDISFSNDPRYTCTLCSPKDIVLFGDRVDQHTELESSTITRLEPDLHYEFFLSVCQN